MCDLLYRNVGLAYRHYSLVFRKLGCFGWLWLCLIRCSVSVFGHLGKQVELLIVWSTRKQFGNVFLPVVTDWEQLLIGVRRSNCVEAKRRPVSRVLEGQQLQNLLLEVLEVATFYHVHDTGKCHTEDQLV